MDNNLNETYKQKNIKKNEKPFFKPIIMSKDDMDKFEEKELRKERRIARNSCYDWYNWSINYIPKAMKKLANNLI